MLNRFVSLMPSTHSGHDRSLCSIAVVPAFAAALLALTGCSMGRLAPPSVDTAAVHLRGVTHGGQQPVSGSTIQLYAAGTTGNASASTPLISAVVLTDANGVFDITGGYTCPSPTTQVYITATGGNPGLTGTVNNSALALMTALGDCGSLASIPSISINEITTVAAAWALAPFASSRSSIGASSGNGTGLRNAMSTAMSLADSTTGSANSSTPPANAITESSKLITLANIIANCVNSDGTTPCSGLFTDVAAGAFPSPADTFQAALAVVTNPSHNVATIFNDMPARTAFGGALPFSPSDWTMSIAYTGGGLSSPAGLAIDASGNVLVSSLGGALSGFSPQGTLLWANGVTGAGLDQSVGVTIDSTSNIWVTNRINASSSIPGSVTQISPSGEVLSGTDGFNGGSINVPIAITADVVGNVWIANQGSPAVTVFSSTGTVVSGPSGYGSTALVRPSAIRIDGLQNVWVADSSGLIVKLNSDGSVNQSVPFAGTPDSLAIDSAGTVWAGDFARSFLGEVASNGLVLRSSLSGGGLFGPRSIAIDGRDHLWITNNAGNSISKFAGSNSPEPSGAVLSPDSGLGVDAHLLQPVGVGVDVSGNVWVTSSADNRLVSFVGLGSPIKTPGFGLPQQP